MFSTPNRSQENQKSLPDHQNKPLNVQESLYETVQKANCYLNPWRQSPERKDSSILATTLFKKSLYQKDPKYLDVATLSYAFGDDEPKKPKQFENKNKSEQNEIIFDKRENLFSQDLVDWDSFLKKGNQNQINKGPVTLPILGFHPKNKDAYFSTPFKEKRHSSSIRNAGNNDNEFRKNSSTPQKSRKPVQRFYSSAGKNSFNDSYDEAEISGQYSPNKHNHSATMDDFISNNINREIVFMPFRSKAIKPQPLSIIQKPSQIEQSDSFLNLSWEFDEGDHGEDTNIKQSDSSKYNSQSFIYPMNPRINPIYKDKGISKSFVNSPIKSQSEKKQQLNPLKPYKLEFSPEEHKLTNQEKNHQKRMNLEKVKQVYSKGRIQKPNVKGIEHLILLKKSQNHSQKMQEYKRRRGLDPNALIFCFNSRDWHIKHALERFGWIENPNVDSVLFNLKWTYRDSETDYQTLSEGQYFNHFGNNQELTMKSGLIRNLIDNAEYGANTASFFPRGYELGQANQINEFKEDFERTALENLLKSLWKYIKNKVSTDTLTEVKKKFWTKEKAKAADGKNKQKRNIYYEYKRKGMHQKYIKYINEEPNGKGSFKQGNNEKLSQRVKTFDEVFEVRNKKWWENWEEDEHREDFLFDVQIVLIALRCLRTIIRQQRCQIIEDDDYFGLNELALKIKHNLLRYSKWDNPYELIPEKYQKAFGTNQNNWRTPNYDMIYRIYKYYTLSKAYFPQFNVDGSQNIWIIKPVGNSRGSGIFLIDSFEEALESGTQNKSRIIQKYIEKPLILYTFPLPSLDGKKFDLRQWVLVTSVNPLIVYMFSSCYLRICSSEFDLRDIKNNFKHLTNFSVNKEKYKHNIQNSVCELDPLKEYLKKTRNINWDIHIKPQIINIILETLHRVSPELEQRAGCFELYGFDLLLDERCKPWLLEVNLSPACAERTPWLVDMLNKMAIGMLELVLPLQFLERHKENYQINTETEIEDKYQNKDYSWDLIFKGEEVELQRKEGTGNGTPALEVVGSKLNWKKDQEFDNKYNWHRLCQIIQKNVKIYLFKRTIQKRIEAKKARVIQKYARGYLARNLLKNMKRMQALEVFKKYMMESLKKRLFSQLKQNNSEVIFRRKIQILLEKREKGVNIIQGLIMKQKMKQFTRNLKQIKAATSIQKHVRIRLKRLKERRELALSILQAICIKHFKKQAIRKIIRNDAVIRIQRWLRQLLDKFREEILTLNLKTFDNQEGLHKVIKIQAYWRMYNTRTAYWKELKMTKKFRESLEQATGKTSLKMKMEQNIPSQSISNHEKTEQEEIEFTKISGVKEKEKVTGIAENFRKINLDKPFQKKNNNIPTKQISEPRFSILNEFEPKSLSNFNRTFISESNTNSIINSKPSFVLEVLCDLKLKEPKSEK